MYNYLVVGVASVTSVSVAVGKCRMRGMYYSTAPWYNTSEILQT